jgi:type VI secretion system protein ImpE
MNGSPFDWSADADMRLGPVLEVIINGRYFWLPFTQVQSLEIEPPSDLRDTVWTAGTLTLVNGGELAALIPTRYPGSSEADPQAMLARATDFEDCGAETFIGIGQRLLATDTGDMPLLDLRELQIAGPEGGDG